MRDGGTTRIAGITSNSHVHVLVFWHLKQQKNGNGHCQYRHSYSNTDNSVLKYNGGQQASLSVADLSTENTFRHEGKQHAYEQTQAFENK